jgi:DNA-binding PadR family transcriptional regulator
VNARPPVNSTAAALLGLLHDGPATGWDLLRVAEERIGDFWTLTPSQVYRELTSLAGAGLIEAGEAGRRQRVPYALTDAGRAAFAGWLGAGPGRDTVRIPLLLTLAFAGHLEPDALRDLLIRERARHAAVLQGYRDARADLDRAPAGQHLTRRATLEYGLRHEAAVLDWFDTLPALLDIPQW